MANKMLLAAFAATAVIVAGAAHAEYPEKAITYIMPFVPGGESDISGRFQQPFFEKLAGKQLIIKYQAGAGGAQAWSQLNSMAGNGYTIMGTNLPHLVLQPMQKDVGYKTEDIDTFYFFHYTPNGIFVPKDSPLKTLKDLIDYAKAHPGQVTFAGSGTFTSNHLAHQRFDELAGIKTTYIPFSGSGACISAVMGHQVTAGFNYPTTYMNQHDSVRMLAVAAEKRVAVFDGPTFKELGIDLLGGTYRGMAVPKSTPEAIKKKLSDIFGKINTDPEFVKKMEDAGFVLINVPYDQVGKFVAERKAQYTALAKTLGIVKK